MEALVVLLVLVGMCVLAPFYSVDSRRFGDRDRRGWWPGTPRRR
jgi:uncharacterized membrane protein YhaH (DUF805 family)